MIDTAGFTALQFELLDDDTLLRVTIDRADSTLNAVDESLHHDLAQLFARLRSDSQLRAVVLTGTPGAFCAGGDFDWFPMLRAPDRLAQLRSDAKAMINDLLDTEVPIIAAITGPAIGLGASIALLCDVIVAAADAKIGDPHVRVGLVAGDGGAVIWPLALGPALAKEFLLTGEPLTAERAERIGLINHVVEPADVADTALNIARTIAANPPLAVRYTKAAINKGIRTQFDAVFDYATALELATFQSADHKEALDAITERRTPRFEGR